MKTLSYNGSIPPLRGRDINRSERMVRMKKTIFVEGMSCQNCVKHVTHALEDIDGVKAVNVDLDKGVANVELLKEVTEQTLIDAIDDAGYTVTKIEG